MDNPKRSWRAGRRRHSERSMRLRPIAVCGLTLLFAACRDSTVPANAIKPASAPSRNTAVVPGSTGEFDADVAVESRVLGSASGGAAASVRYHLSRTRGPSGWMIVLTALDPRLINANPRVLASADHDVARLEIDELTGAQRTFLRDGRSFSPEISTSHVDGLGRIFQDKRRQFEGAIPAPTGPRGRTRGLPPGFLISAADVDAMHARMRARFGAPDDDGQTLVYHAREAGGPVDYAFDRVSRLPRQVSGVGPNGAMGKLVSTYQQIAPNLFARTTLHSEFARPSGSGTVATDVTIANVDAHLTGGR